jgi:Cu/Ag efflux pump CusA
LLDALRPLIEEIELPAGYMLEWGGVFDFMSMLGVLSLVGLLIKNAIVLIEEIDQQIEGGKDGYDAILDSSVSRTPCFSGSSGHSVLQHAG